MSCPACGKSNEGDAAFCKHCGANDEARQLPEKADATTWGVLKRRGVAPRAAGAAPWGRSPRSRWCCSRLVGSSAGAQAQDALPSGHPEVDSSPHGHGNGAAGAMPGVFEPPEDTEAARLHSSPRGRSPSSCATPTTSPCRGVEITLGILVNSIAKGDSQPSPPGYERRSGRRDLSRSRDCQQHRLPGERRLPGWRVRGDALPARSRPGRCGSSSTSTP